jgi:sugar lactone lactonase YvrE
MNEESAMYGMPSICTFRAAYHRRRIGLPTLLAALIALGLTTLLLPAGAHAAPFGLDWGTFAGCPGESGCLNSGGFSGPSGLACDGSGNIYVADTGNHTIRKVTPAGVASTLAGLAGVSGSTDGQGDEARFFQPAGVACDAGGNVYVADTGNHAIRKVTPDGVVTTLAGMAGVPGAADGTGAASAFFSPQGVACNPGGIVYVADSGNHTIRKITPSGVVTTIAGAAGAQGSIDGPGSVARFRLPTGIACDAAGKLYVADTNNHTVRVITSAGVVSTLAGTAGSSGSATGTGAAARFNFPKAVTCDAAGTLCVADWANHTVRRITSAGVVTTLAGAAGSPGATDGTGAAARFLFPAGVVCDSVGTAFVADQGNHTMRRVTSAGVVTTLAGTVGYPGAGDGVGSAARFDYPQSVACDSSGNVYVADYANQIIRRTTAGGVVTTLAGSPGSSGATDGTGAAARFNGPRGVACDAAGNVYVADSGNHTIRKITPAGVVTTLAGTAGSSGSVDGTGAAARFFIPQSVACDSSGSTYVADTGNQTMRRVTSAGVVTTIAGTPGVAGAADGIGAAACSTSPAGYGATPPGGSTCAPAATTPSAS